jgi:isopentenyl diphosphate isomerase/L-lactate dehydrogenase-like FMN-dependent dehydrogenase
MTAPFAAYQAEIYLNGLAGVLPEFTTDASALEESARRRLEPGPFWYVAGAAGTGATARANREAFDRWRIVPRMLRDATTRNLSTTVLGTEMPAPVLTAPVGVQSIVHPDGELATARAASALGLPMVLSTASSYTIEEVAACAGGPAYQLYRSTTTRFATSERPRRRVRL